MPRKTKLCSIEGCSRKHLSRGYCRMHYCRFKSRGDAGGHELERTRGRKCSIEGCEQDHCALGYCALHYARFRKRKDAGGVGLERIRNRGCAVDGCAKPHNSGGYCAMHYQRVKTHGDPGSIEPRRVRRPSFISNKGYKLIYQPDHPNVLSRGYIGEHTVVMSEKLGRSLTKGETVHHKNGVRLDNRPKNLELWVTTQPSGQRVTDRIADAVELLLRYADDPSLWPKRHQLIRELIGRQKKCRSSTSRRAAKPRLAAIA